MERLGISAQTLKEFIHNPFGQPNNQKYLQYESRYQSFKRNNKIKLVKCLFYEDNYFLHVSVPSESQKGATHYDVVIQFFTPKNEVKRELTLSHYYVQFFSNSPGFMYKYAALYKLEGYLIDSLFDKFQPGMLDVLPDKANKDYELFYDSSIYYACRYILDNKFTCMGKLNLRIFSTRNVTQFFENIQDTESIGIMTDISKLERSIKKEISDDNKLSQTAEVKLKSSKNKLFGKEIAKRHTTNKTHKVGKKHAGKSTSRTTITKVVGGKSKIIGRKTTKHDN